MVVIGYKSIVSSLATTDSIKPKYHELINSPRLIKMGCSNIFRGMNRNKSEYNNGWEFEYFKPKWDGETFLDF